MVHCIAAQSTGRRHPPAPHLPGVGFWRSDTQVNWSHHVLDAADCLSLDLGTGFKTENTARQLSPQRTLSGDDLWERSDHPPVLIHQASAIVGDGHKTGPTLTSWLPESMGHRSNSPNNPFPSEAADTCVLPRYKQTGH